MPADHLPVVLMGQTERYKGNGRKLGYPTANLDIPTKLDDGLYFGFARLKTWQHQPAIIFVGVPITMGDTVRRVEAHLLNIPDIDYYGLELELSIEFFYRKNQKFNNMADLIAEMERDVSAARIWFSKNN